ncbi:MAG: DUF58 domain-containing protein [Verrucomicrobiota bacterium JB022]|nr:DUF58 domain-containing protein [Verrucomicrobiota bacterium JB022]
MSAEAPALAIPRQARADAIEAAAKLALNRTARHRQRMTGRSTSPMEGASLEFQDQRDYHPGDDFRHLNWRAFARTDRLLMKVFEAEVSPLTEVIFDRSASMFAPEGKARLTWALLLFMLEASRQEGARLRLWMADHRGLEAFDPRALGGEAATFAPAAGASGPQIDQPLHSGSLRILISDLLFGDSPAPLLSTLARNAGEAWVLVPQEPLPDLLDGQTTFDCRESGRQRVLRVDAAFRRSLQERYDRHLSDWQRSAQSHGTSLLRVSPALPFVEALRLDGLRSGFLRYRT